MCTSAAQQSPCEVLRSMSSINKCGKFNNKCEEVGHVIDSRSIFKSLGGMSDNCYHYIYLAEYRSMSQNTVLPIAHCIHLPVMPHVSTQTEAAKEVL